MLIIAYCVNRAGQIIDWRGTKASFLSFRGFMSQQRRCGHQTSTLLTSTWYHLVTTVIIASRNL